MAQNSMSIIGISIPAKREAGVLELTLSSLLLSNHNGILLCYFLYSTENNNNPFALLILI